MMFLLIFFFTFNTDKAIFILFKYHVHSLTYINVSSLDLRNSNSDSFTTFYNYRLDCPQVYPPPIRLPDLNVAVVSLVFLQVVVVVKVEVVID